MNPDVEEGNRQTYDLLNWMEDVGGFYGAIKIFFDVFIYYLHKSLDFKDIFMIRHLFKSFKKEYKGSRIKEMQENAS